MCCGLSAIILLDMDFDMTDSWKLTIYRGGVKHADQTLDPGKAYVAGRDPDCDIVLPSSLVSRKHTRLVVDSNDVLVEDADSSNGTYIEGNKISSQRVNGAAPISVGEYKLELTSNRTFRAAWSNRLGTLLTLFGNHPYQFSIMLVTAMVLFTIWSLHGPYESRVEKIRNESAKSHAMLVAQSLLTINESYWQKGVISNFKIAPFDSQDGVEQVYIVNQYAGVLAPQSSAYDILDDVELEQALTPPGHEVVITKPQGGGKIFLPVRRNDTVLGAVIVYFAPPQEQEAIPLTKFGLIILLLLLLAALAGYFMVTTFLRPWRQLAEEADVAVGEGKNLFSQKLPYPDLQRYKILYERLLLKLQNVESDQAHLSSRNRQNELQQRSSSVVQMPLSKTAAVNKDGYTCTLDRSSHHIIHCSTNFAQQFEIDPSQSVHLLDAFKNHENLLTGVTKLLDDESGEFSTTIRDQTFIVSSDLENDGALKIIFEQSKYAS